jgi:uroporphyrinogen decarboxylase
MSTMREGIRKSGNCRAIAPALWDSVFLKTCRGEAAPHTPIWLMRQAGRYMKEYRAMRATRTFLELCKDADMAAEATVFARNWLGVDAAIIFSDILVVLEALGLPLTFATGDGPHLPKPIRDAAAVAALKSAAQAAADLDYVYRAIGLCVRALPTGIPLIGFCGGPFTLASYAIEGGGSRHFTHTKAFMYREGEAWHRLLDRLVDTLIDYLNRQIAAGATCVQIFDSWIGNLGRTDYLAFVDRHLRRLIAGVAPGVPVILFGTGTNHLIDLLAATGCDVIGADTVTDLSEAWSRCGGPGTISVQGNLDPCALLAPREHLISATRSVLNSAGSRPGHIFNLGHGIVKETDPEQAKFLVDYVRETSRR